MSILCLQKWNRAGCFWLLGIILVFLIITTFAILQIARFVMLVELIKDGSNTDSNSTSIRTKLDYMLNVLGQSAYCLEYITLIYDLYKFSCYYCKLNDTDKRGTGTDGNGNNPTTINDKNQVKKNNWYNNNCGIFVLVVVISLIAWLLHFSLSFIPPILLIWREDIVLGYKSSIRKANTYASLAFLDHYYNFLTWTGMFFVTVLVVHTWMKAAKNIKVEEKYGKMIKNLVKNYTESGEYVNALQTIFQGWFVIKWIIYFNDIIGHSVLAAETIFKSENNDVKHELGYVLAYLVYDFLAFFFLFFCGSLMNLYHSKYCQRQKLLLNATDVTPVVILESSSTLIPVNPEYDFLPSVCMIDFPLNSPGYIVTMFLALFAFVANFITQFE